MSSNISILGLCAKRTLPKIISILIVSCGAQLALYFAGVLPDLFVYNGRYILVYAAAAILSVLVLGGPRSDKTNQMLRIRMLKISERKWFFLNAVFNILILVVVWAVHAAVLLVMMRRFLNTQPYDLGPQGLYYEMLRPYSALVLLPIDDGAMLASQLACVVGLGLAAAGLQYCRVNKKIAFITAVDLLLFVFAAASSISSRTGFITFTAIMFAMELIAFIFRNYSDEEG